MEEMEEEKAIYITDIFWDRVFLHIIIEGIGLEEQAIYLTAPKDIHRIELMEIAPNCYEASINITNIDNKKMLGNASYNFKIKRTNVQDDAEEEIVYERLEITNDVGYKLANLDKVFRYYKDCYAYTVNFVVQQTESDKITCVLKSRFMQINRKPQAYCKITKKSKAKSWTKNVVQNSVKYSLIALYKISSFLHFNKKNKILLMSETRSPISGNLKALDKRLKERGLDKTYKISYSFSKTLETRKVDLVFNWIKMIWLVSKQEFVFIDDYAPLFKFINLSKKTKLIQVWHAGVGFKSVGYARFGFAGPEPYNSCHRKYDYAIVGSKALIPVYQEVFGIENKKILPYGVPRLDNYLDEKHIAKAKEEVYERYSILKDKKVILFAPTYRGNGQRKAYYPYEKLDLEEIYNLCNEKDYMFVIKMHPFIKEKIIIPEEYSNKIIDASDYQDINDLLYITDILITDYSSNIYDYSLLNRPIILYAFDLDCYQLKDNSIQRPVKKYAPGKVCERFSEVIETIKNEDFCLEKLKKYREENFDDMKASSCDLIIDNIILKGEKDDKKATN